MSRTYKDHKKYKNAKCPHWEWFPNRGIPSDFKKERRRWRRNKNKQELRENKEPTKFRKSDHWDWW